MASPVSQHAVELKDKIMAFSDLILGSADHFPATLLRPQPASSTTKAGYLARQMRPTAQELVARLIGHRARMKLLTGPRIGVSISVYTPGGRPAVEINV
jgi:hypothetical protein